MPSLEKILAEAPKYLFNKDSWKTFANYVGLGGLAKSRELASPESLGYFLRTRASHVAQASLYGYLKTRAGTRFPEMFENEGILMSMNMAKWQIWLACLSDLTVYTGGLIAQRTGESNRDIQALLADVTDEILADVGTPDDAAEEFQDTCEALRIRIRNTDYGAVTDDESAFTQSPESLYRWAPIADELKVRDKEIVINSVRFRWQEVRRSVRKLLRAESLLPGEATQAQ